MFTSRLLFSSEARPRSRFSNLLGGAVMILQVPRGAAGRPHTLLRIGLLFVVSLIVGCGPRVVRRMRETFDIGALSYTVRDKEVRSRLYITGSTVEAGEHAMFVVIRYDVVNRGKEYEEMNPFRLRLETTDGTTYYVDKPATIAKSMSDTFEGSSPQGSGLLSPGSHGSYTAVFRVAEDVVRDKLYFVIRGEGVVLIE